jgi:hypothetical protein
MAHSTAAAGTKVMTKDAITMPATLPALFCCWIDGGGLAFDASDDVNGDDLAEDGLMDRQLGAGEERPVITLRWRARLNSEQTRLKSQQH